MTQIAYARTFDGDDDYIEVADGSLVGEVNGLTLAAIIKSSSDIGARTVHAISDPDGYDLFLGDNDGGIVAFYNGVNTNASGTVVATTAMGWCLVAITKADGNTTPRFHCFQYGGSWVHANGNFAQSDPTGMGSTSECFIGAFAPSEETFNGKIACVGVWLGTVLSDGQLEGLTDDIAAWEALSPTSLWLLDQDDVTTTILDRTGTSDQIARVGTTATAVSDLAFDVGGEPAPPGPPLHLVQSNLRW
jgi:hypothetical protein